MGREGKNHGIRIADDFLDRIGSHPVFTPKESHEYESELLTSDDQVWSAMNSVGQKLSDTLLFEYGFTRFRKSDLCVLGLIGKGHNGGDALLAIDRLVCLGCVRKVILIVSSKLDDLRPLTRRAFDTLSERLNAEQIEVIALNGGNTCPWLKRVRQIAEKETFNICLDGLLGMQFRPPLREYFAELLEIVNRDLRIKFRAAVDLPSGISDKKTQIAFDADVTFATGILKSSLLHSFNAEHAGCIRYLDIGFFHNPLKGSKRVLCDRILDPLRESRSPVSEKRSFGHLFILAGSRQMAGALAMCVRAAIQSGAGLVTVFAPESVVPSLSASMPEAMWIAWPETPDGGLALEGIHLFMKHAKRASALIVGPGMGREKETLALVSEVIKSAKIPLLLDADALQESSVSALEKSEATCVITPHAGEYARITEYIGETEKNLSRFAKRIGGIVVRKGNNTRISDGDTELMNVSGNAVLARGGTGDALSGLIGGLMAFADGKQLEAAAMGVYWHGKAADLVAYNKGQHAVRTLDIIDALPDALREGNA